MLTRKLLRRGYWLSSFSRITRSFWIELTPFLLRILRDSRVLQLGHLLHRVREAIHLVHALPHLLTSEYLPETALPDHRREDELALVRVCSRAATFLLRLYARGADAAPHNRGYIAVPGPIKSSRCRAPMNTQGRSQQPPLLACPRELPLQRWRRERASPPGPFPGLLAAVPHRQQPSSQVRPVTKLANSKASSSFRVSTNIRETRYPLGVRARFPDLKANCASVSEERTATAKVAQNCSLAPKPVCFLHRPTRVRSLHTFDASDKADPDAPQPSTALPLRSRLRDSSTRGAAQEHPLLGSLPPLSSRSWVR